MNNDPDICTSCGQRMAYRSAVSRGVVVTLQAIKDFVEAKGINTVHLRKEMVDAGKITVTQFGNRTHLVRLGLIADMAEPGNYCLTTKALGFLAGDPIPKEVGVQKRTEGKGSHTTESSEETCTISQFRKKSDFWEVPGFEIREGRVITTVPAKQRQQVGLPPRKVAVLWNGAVQQIEMSKLDAFLAYHEGAQII